MSIIIHKLYPKLYSAIVIFLLINSSAFAQGESMLEYVLSLQSIGPIQEGSTLTFDNDEQILNSWAHEFVFSSQGYCLSHKRHLYQNNLPTQVYIYKYDEFNRIIYWSYALSSYAIASGDAADSWSFEYNEHGDVVEEILHSVYYGYQISHDYLYDEFGNILSHQIKSYSSILIVYENEYDEFGRMIQSTTLKVIDDSNELFVSENVSYLYEGDLLTQKETWKRNSELEDLKLQTVSYYSYDQQGNNTEIYTSQLDTVLDVIVPAFRETIVYVDGNVIERNTEQWHFTSEEYIPFELRNYSYYPETTFLESESFQKWNTDLQSYSYVFQRSFSQPCQHSTSQPFENEYPKLITNSSFYPMLLFDEATKPSSLKVSFYSYDGKLLKEYSNPSNKDLYFEFKEAWRLISGLYLILVETESYSKTFKWQRERY